MTVPLHLTRAYIRLDHLTHNVHLLQDLVGKRRVWPAIKANAYGHGLVVIARHLTALGYDTLCVAHINEALALREAGVKARLLLLSATSPEHSESIVKSGCEPVVCTLEMVNALAHDAQHLGRQVAVHLMVDTGMGRIGIRPEETIPFLEHCSGFSSVRLRGIMSHFPCADQRDKSFSLEQIVRFEEVVKVAGSHGIQICHMANSAAVLDLPESHFDGVRPGIAIYGLPPSSEIVNPRVKELRPVLEWKTRITFLKEVAAGVGLSYGHIFHTKHPSLIATVPVGYGDGLSRNLSNNIDLLVRGKRCPQVGRITMDQSLIDVTELRGEVELDDEVILIGRQGKEEVTADELAEKLGTINYEVVTAIAKRVPRVIRNDDQ
ncbi:MAG: alanine racemase [Pseudomonadota bacterium]